LSFFWKRGDDPVWRPENATTKGEHPLAYMNRARDAYPDREYKLLFFYEIPPEVFAFARGAATTDDQ
jgi:hypothetical protein